MVAPTSRQNWRNGSRSSGRQLLVVQKQLHQVVFTQRDEVLAVQVLGHGGNLLGCLSSTDAVLGGAER